MPGNLLIVETKNSRIRDFFKAIYFGDWPNDVECLTIHGAKASLSWLSVMWSQGGGHLFYSIQLYAFSDLATVSGKWKTQPIERSIKNSQENYLIFNDIKINMCQL